VHVTIQFGWELTAQIAAGIDHGVGMEKFPKRGVLREFYKQTRLRFVSQPLHLHNYTLTDGKPIPSCPGDKPILAFKLTCDYLRNNGPLFAALRNSRY